MFLSFSMQAIQGTGHLLGITLEAWNARSLEDQTGKQYEATQEL